MSIGKIDYKARKKEEYKDFYFSYGFVCQVSPHLTEWAIYSYLRDGSFRDIEASVALSDRENIEDYILENYGDLLPS